MASEKNEIGDIVKKCKILLLDIEGTTTSISFVKDKLFPYADANVKEFLESQWENEDVKEAVAALRKLAVEDQEKNVEGAVAIPGEDAGKEDQIEGLVKSVQWLMAADRKAGPLKQLQGLIWKQGYDKGDIKGHVYDDVQPALELWRSIEGQKVYIYSSGSVQAQKFLFNMSVAGDLLPLIEGHFDTAVGAKQEAASYVAIAEKIGSKPEEILFLTDIVKEAEAARASGLQAALVSREGNAPLPDEATSSYPVLQSFEQLTVSNKRKPDPQEDEVPSKVPKTDIEDDVKTGSEMEAQEAAPASEVVTSSESVVTPKIIITTETISKEADEPEKMEVEEEVTVAEISTATEKVEKEAEKEEDMPLPNETTIVEVTNSNEAGDTPVSEIEPIIEESVEKTEKNETEKMEVEDEEPVDKSKELKELAQKKVDEQSVPVAEKTLPSDITIQDVTEEQQSASEGTEVVEESVPLVEEPPNIEIEELKNVGDVLEKECDEILSKVQDVTNLDDIPIKPLLNSVAEEPIESGNGENTNDIVESILDSEMELSKKPCEDIDVNTLQKIVDAKPDVLEEKEAKANVEKASNSAEEKTIDTIVDKNTVENVEENKIKETTVKCSKDPKEMKMDENGSTETEDQIKKDEISKDESATREVTNGDVQNSKSEPVEEKIEMTDSISEPKSDSIVEEKECKPIPAASVEKNTPVDPDNKVETKAMELEKDTTTSIKNPLEIKETIAEPVEKKAEESISEPVDSIMESSDSAADPIEDQKQSEDIAVKSVDNKTEIKKGTVESEDTKIESKVQAGTDNKSGSKGNKSLSNDNKNGSDDNKSEAADTKIETVDTKGEAVDTKNGSDDIKGESVDIKSGSDNTKSEAVDKKSEAVYTKSEPVGNKNGSGDIKGESVDVKSGSDDTKSEAVDKKSEAVDKKSEAVDTKGGSDGTKRGSDGTKRGSDDNEMEYDNSKVESENNKSVDTKMETEDSMPQESKTDESVAKPEAAEPENKADGKGPSMPITTEEATESKDSASNDVQMEIDVTEKRRNGNTNGKPDVTSNGDASKEEELNARLSVENGDNTMEVNGANGNGESTEIEAGQGDNKMDTEISDIKIKTVASEDPRPDPIEQPVEA